MAEVVQGCMWRMEVAWQVGCGGLEVHSGGGRYIHTYIGHILCKGHKGVTDEVGGWVNSIAHHNSEHSTFQSAHNLLH